jgi:hypothetical protein
LLGWLVIRFHGSSLPYFIMTAGLFPAVALGISSGDALRLLPVKRPLIVAILLVALFASSAFQALELLQGSQRNQRATTNWIRNSELAKLRGFQLEGGLFCANDPDPFRPMFSPQIYSTYRFSPAASEDLIAEFRSRPIAYMVESYRLREFPDSVKLFWDTHYVRSFGSVILAGFHLRGGTEPLRIDVIVPGRYRWVPFPEGATAIGPRAPTLYIDDVPVAGGDTVALQTGAYSAKLGEGVSRGRLELAVQGPHPDFLAPFFDPRQVLQIVAKRY